MIKAILLMGMSLWVAACSAQDEHYYSMNPQALQQAIKQCPAQPPKKITCDELERIAARINLLAFELRSNPQGYGQDILSLQQVMAKQEEALKQNANQPELKVSFNKNKKLLQERIAIVRWLESPES